MGSLWHWLNTQGILKWLREWVTLVALANQETCLYQRLCSPKDGHGLSQRESHWHISAAVISVLVIPENALFKRLSFFPSFVHVFLYIDYSKKDFPNCLVLPCNHACLCAKPFTLQVFPYSRETGSGLSLEPCLQGRGPVDGSQSLKETLPCFGHNLCRCSFFCG